MKQGDSGKDVRKQLLLATTIATKKCILISSSTKTDQSENWRMLILNEKTNVFTLLLLKQLITKIIEELTRCFDLLRFTTLLLDVTTHTNSDPGHALDSIPK